MSLIKDVKRRLETSLDSIEALDADLAAGKLGVDDHAHQRLQLEREVGRLYVDLKRAQRESRQRRQDHEAAAPAATAWWVRSPAAAVSAALFLVIVGVGGGVMIVRRPGTMTNALTSTGGAPGVPAAMSAIAPELKALEQAASQPDAPIAGLLEFAHTALDQGRLDEARATYDRVLAREPKNVEAITHIGAVLYQEHQVDAALAKVDEALRIDPRYVHALWDRTEYLYRGKRDFPAAITSGEAFLAVVPDGPDAENVKKLIAEARRERATSTTR